MQISTSRPCPTRNSATSFSFPTVAESPILWNLPDRFSSLSRATLSCAPLSVSASSWISSTMTHLTFFRWLMRFFPVNITCSVSGVVIMMSGGFLDCFALSPADVSPCLTSTVTSSSFPRSVMRFIMSLLSALSGVMYSTLIPGFFGELCSASNIGSIAVSVLPMPVGATRSMFLPVCIFGLATRCGSVGSVMPRSARMRWSSSLR